MWTTCVSPARRHLHRRQQQQQQPQPQRRRRQHRGGAFLLTVISRQGLSRHGSFWTPLPHPLFPTHRHTAAPSPLSWETLPAPRAMAMPPSTKPSLCLLVAECSASGTSHLPRTVSLLIGRMLTSPMRLEQPLWRPSCTCATVHKHGHKLLITWLPSPGRLFRSSSSCIATVSVM